MYNTQLRDLLVLENKTSRSTTGILPHTNVDRFYLETWDICSFLIYDLTTLFKYIYIYICVCECV